MAFLFNLPMPEPRKPLLLHFLVSLQGELFLLDDLLSSKEEAIVTALSSVGFN